MKRAISSMNMMRMYMRCCRMCMVSRMSKSNVFSCFNTASYLKSLILNKKTSPNGAVDFMIFGLENHKIPSHYDLHIKNFNSCELKFLIEYQYKNRLCAA